MHHSIFLWIGFNVFILAMLLVDLLLFHRKAHEVKLKEALIWSGVWIGLALLFSAGVHFFMGHEKALEFLAGYLIEKSLSVDNIFVFLVIFSYFQIPSKYQHTILFWGILGALVMRGVFIMAGVAALERFHGLIYVFGAFLVYTGIRLISDKDKKVEPERNPVIKLFRRVVPVSATFGNGKFFIREGGRWCATTLFVVLLVVELTDVVFAVDSIPAVLCISHDSFIVYTSNAFAILGLRALYLALAGVMKYFHYLSYGLSVVLVFVGIKMLISHWYKIPIGAALGVVGGVLLVSVLASLVWPDKKHGAH